MQSTKAKKAEELGRKAKLAQSYQELLDEFNDKELRSVGNYTLGRLIGKGSFGKVYLATHKLTNGSKVVLKSANKDDANLAREIHHHRQFVHPHIARLYEVIVTESLVWLVLEYCPGDELYNYLLKHGRLPVEKVQKTFAQLVGAVCYVHQQSCVHRDLKLENILLDKHENVKLCDFGFTREYEGKANYLQTFCGTICYSAPEMLKGEKYAGEKVDVWSLGVILYALLCGELPFDDDDDNVTRTKILTEEPHYPDYIPPDALSLLKSLLSKRPLLRPSLPEILAHPFLADYAAQQQEILRLERPEPFSTPLEKETLLRMRSAGVNVESVMESVLAQRCDVLAGWWTLLIEKEERKRRRREQKRQEREQEKRASRRFSQASSRLNALATVEESQFVKLGDPPQPRSRGRSERRSGYYPNLNIPDVPDLSDRFANGNLSPDSEAPPPPIDKDSIRSVSTTRARKPIPPPKEGVLRSARSRGSTLHLVTTSDALEAASTAPAPSLKPKKRPSRAIIATWKNWTHWLFENTRRHRSTGKRGNQSAPDLPAKDGKEGPKPVDASPRPQTSKYPGGAASSAPQVASLPKGVVANGFSRGAGSSAQTLSSHPATSGISTPPVSGYGSNTTNNNNGGSSSSHHPPRLHTSGSSTYKRHSLSPSPLTPRSTVRRSSGPGLRGRKSTSSSVSSVRSLHYPAHHTHTHSKASSTSSNGSVSTNLSKTPLQATRSPHHSVKVLPATPTTGVFPSNLRLVRDKSAPPLALFNEALPGAGLSSGRGGSGARTPTPGSPNPFSSSAAGGGAGVLFAKRKRNIFKGPMLSFSSSGGGGLHARRDLAEHHGGRSRSGSGGGAGPSSSLSQGEGSSSGGGHHSRSASASGLGRRPSGECAIQEVDEDEEEQEQRLEEIRMQMMGRYSPGVGMTLGQLGLGGPGGFHRMSGMLEEDEDEVEEVDAFSPIVKGPGEIVEEKIYDEDEVVGVEGLGLGVGKLVGEDINDNPGVGDEGGNGNGGGGGGGGNGLGGLQPAPEIKAAGETAKG